VSDYFATAAWRLSMHFRLSGVPCDISSSFASLCVCGALLKHLRGGRGCASHGLFCNARSLAVCWLEKSASRRLRRQGLTIMSELLASYIPIAIFIGIALVIGLALLIAPFAVAYKAPDSEKLSAYECGFNAFDDARMKFDIRFYLVSILFIIFDLEVAFLFPWAVSLKEMGWFGFWSMMVFLGVLTIGFIYEWKKGALEWE
jgi:NADH-quinone oxidoreductase subunit A